MISCKLSQLLETHFCFAQEQDIDNIEQPTAMLPAGMHALQARLQRQTVKQSSDSAVYKLSFRTLIVAFEYFQMLTSFNPVIYHLVIWILVCSPRLQSSACLQRPI